MKCKLEIYAPKYISFEIKSNKNKNIKNKIKNIYIFLSFVVHNTIPKTFF